MKKIVLAVMLSVSLFGGGFKCNLYLDRTLEKADLLNFSIERGDLDDMARYSVAKVKYLEHSIASCGGILSEDDIGFLKKDRADTLQMRKNFNLE